MQFSYASSTRHWRRSLFAALGFVLVAANANAQISIAPPGPISFGRVAATGSLQAQTPDIPPGEAYGLEWNLPLNPAALTGLRFRYYVDGQFVREFSQAELTRTDTATHHVWVTASRILPGFSGGPHTLRLEAINNAGSASVEAAALAAYPDGSTAPPPTPGGLRIIRTTTEVAIAADGTIVRTSSQTEVLRVPPDIK